MLAQVSQEAAAFLILRSCKRAAAFLLQLIPHCIPAVPVPQRLRPNLAHPSHVSPTPRPPQQKELKHPLFFLFQ